MNTKGAHLLLSTTLLIASCVASPAFADDKAKVDGGKTAASNDASNEMSEEDKKNIGKDRGIIVSEIGNKPDKKKNEKKQPSTQSPIKPVANVLPLPKHEGSSGGMTGPRSIKVETPRTQPAKAAPKTTTTKPVVTKKSPAVTAVEIKKSPSNPILVKTTPKSTTTTTKPAAAIKSTPPKEAVATKSTTVHKQPAVHVEAGDSIVTAWLNKSGDKPRYKDGERLQVNVAASKDCNLMIFNYDGEQLTQLYPNEFQQNPFVRAGQTIEVGGEGFKFDFTAANTSSRPSNEKIFVYAYPIESDSAPISIAMNRIPSSPFRAAEMTPEQYRDMVNKSEVFFGRKVKVTAKKHDVEEVQLAAYEHESAAPNKIELQLVIDGTRRN